MNIQRIFKIFVLLAISLIISSQLVFASEIKKRMKERLPAIAALKTKGVIGENNKGYLGFVSNVTEQEDLIEAENKDRKMIYTYFAKKQNTTLDNVEEIQAKRKAKKTKPGVFYQKSDGIWVKK